MIHHEPHEFRDVLDLARFFNVFYALELKIEKGHSAWVPISRVDVPFMPLKVVLVKKFGSLGRFWDQSFRLLYVAMKYLCDIGAELFTIQFEVFIRNKLSPTNLGYAFHFFSTLFGSQLLEALSFLIVDFALEGLFFFLYFVSRLFLDRLWGIKSTPRNLNCMRFFQCLLFWFRI